MPPDDKKPPRRPPPRRYETPPASEKHDEDETPTQPDAKRFSCPACKDDSGHPRGFILHIGETGASYHSQLSTCTICMGKKIIDRDSLMRWRDEELRKKLEGEDPET